MAALEIIGARNGFKKLKNQPERSDLLDIRRSISFNLKPLRRPDLLDIRRSISFDLKPLRRRMVQAALIAESASSSSWSSASTSSSFPSIGPDPLNLVPRTSYFSHENSNWRKHESEAVTQDKLDQWLRDSIAEIVKDIGKAPMLVHMFSHPGGASVSIESESVSPDIWLRITRRWSREGRMPDGVILVEELNGESEENQTWGLVVQGRGGDCPSCYILTTCRVRSSAGFCTHFCLVRAECYGESADMQLRRAWSL